MLIKVIQRSTIVMLFLTGCINTPNVPVATGTNVVSSNAAVVTLVDNARSAIVAGKLEVADLSLERALHIEPSNPAIWNELASLRLQQEQFDQAINFAAKSNALAGNNKNLQAHNWQLIGQARAKRGDTVGAQDAFAKAAGLTN